MSFTSVSKFFLTVSAALMLASIVLLVWPGPKLSMEFTGGTLINISLPQGKSKADVQTAAASFATTDGKSLGNFTLSTTKEGKVLIRMRTIGNEDHLAFLDHLKKTVGDVTEHQFTTIGPTVGATLKRRSMEALVIASLGIVLYIAIAFYKVPRRLSPWRFGIFAVVAMIHDMLVTTGVFVMMGLFTNFEFDTLFITALLTILGYSVNDTIIIFDRIRENVAFADKREDFTQVVSRSLWETMTRTLNTSITTLIVLFSLFFLGSESIHWFVLALIIGICLGNYSSYFIATPLLVFLRKKE